MVAKQKTKAASVPQCQPRIKLWLEFEGEHVFGAGMCQILEAVEKTGSIKDAATLLGRSYRAVWNQIKTCEKGLGQPLIAAQVGGHGTRRSSLTPLGTNLVTQFASLRKQLMQLTDEHVLATQPLLVPPVRTQKRTSK